MLSVKSLILRLGLIGVLFAALLTACSAPTATAEPTIAQATDSLPVNTPVFTTVPPTNSPIPPSPTLTAVILKSSPTTGSIEPTATKPAAQPTATTATGACTNRARFVGETIPDDTSFLAGGTFKKTWTLENSGTCTWTTAYQVRFESGQFMGAGLQSQPLPAAVAPGERITLEVSMVAPAQAGTYTSNFMLVDASGKTFGIGSSGSAPFYVRIVARACLYKAALVSETFPPGTKVWVGEVFWKKWTLKNTGECPWIGVRHPWVTDGGFGYPPGAPRDGNTGGDAQPGGTIALELPLITPMQAGSHTAEFKIGFYTNSNYDTPLAIGLGDDGSTLLKANIVAIEPPASEAELGAPTIFDSFDKNEGWWSLSQASNSNVTFDITAGSLVMSIKQGYEYYTIRTLTERRGQVHQAVFVTGENCTGKNGYGLMLGLDLNVGTGSYKSGHLVRLTCNGQYSIEYLDWNAYTDGIKPLVLVPLTATAAINAGPNQTNRVTVIGAGGRMIVMINGAKVVELVQSAEFKATQYENGAVMNTFDLDLSKFEYTTRPYVGMGLPGLFIDGEESSLTVRVDEYRFWNLDDQLK